jgi:hypothetical protein
MLKPSAGADGFDSCARGGAGASGLDVAEARKENPMMNRQSA